MKHTRWLVGLVALVTTLTVGLSPATAAPPTEDARSQRLEALDDADRALLAPLMERGPISLIEFAKGDTLPAVLVAGFVEASPDQVASVIAKPKDYPKFMATLDSVNILSESPTQTAYRWTWQTGMISLEGENRMTVLSPPKDKPELGHRISIKSERGQMGEGRFLWRVLPSGPNRSFVSLSMRVDMRDANFILRQLGAAARSVNRSVNIALAHVMLIGTKKEAEKRAGNVQKLPPSVPLDAPKVDLVALTPLLGKADLLLMELTDKGLGKLSVVGRGGTSPEKLRAVMTEPETFGKSLVPGSYTKITKREGTTKNFAWGVDLPLIGTEGEMKMADKDGIVFIDATQGALKGGRWRFRTPTLPGGEGAVIGWSQFDVAKTGWLVEKIASIDPAMGHGLAAATQVMLLRALRKRVKQEEVEAEKAKGPAKAGMIESTLRTAHAD